LDAGVRWLETALGWLLPPRCLGCGEAATGRELCRRCASMLPENRCACPRCAIPLPAPAPLCGLCLRRPPPFSAAWAPFVYADPVDRWLAQLKFRHGLAAGRLLAAELATRVPAHCGAGIDVAVPMPLHRQRLRERGYNQALELLRPLAARRGWRLSNTALRRERDTPHQLGLDARTRRRNLRGAFVAAPSEVEDRRVLLFDDVITTGSSVREAAATLRAAGAAEVQVLAVARAAGR
jgi:ComF family protein